jgi:dynein heavy chain
LKEWDAYIELKKEIDDFVEILPMLKDLSKKSIQPRHWASLKEITKTEFSTGSEDMFYLNKLLEANLLDYKEEIEEIIESADKQMKIEE